MMEESSDESTEIITSEEAELAKEMQESAELPKSAAGNTKTWKRKWFYSICEFIIFFGAYTVDKWHKLTHLEDYYLHLYLIWIYILYD